MSRIATPPVAPTAPLADDPFAIGWRDVYHRQLDGTEVLEQVPLTLEDALHPQYGDVIVENSAHNRNCRYVHDVLEKQLAGDPTALVLGDCKVLWEDGVYHSPDIAVIFG